MNTKLTLTLEKEIIEEAKKYASNKGRSLSEMVEHYFRYLTESKKLDKSTELSPRVNKLKGIVKVESDFDYKRTLKEEIDRKHGI